MRIISRIFVFSVCLVVTTLIGYSSEPIRLKVLSYNIHHAEGVDRKLDLGRIAKVISQSRADIVALQEVDQGVRRSGNSQQAKELARLTKMNFAFGKNINLQGGEYGNAVLSRFDLVKQQNHQLPCLDKGEQRGVLEVHVGVPGIRDTIRVLATHFDHRKDDKERILSAKEIHSILGNDTKPSLLIGDINDVLSSDTLHELQKTWQSTNQEELFTIPVDVPKQQIDFIFVRKGQTWRVINTVVLEEEIASDHRPILCELEWIGE